MLKRRCLMLLAVMPAMAAGAANATSCLPPPPTSLAENYAAATDVFVARIGDCLDCGEGAEAPGESHRYAARLDETIKDGGVPLSEQLYLPAAGFMGCGIHLRTNQTYLVFASDSGGLRQGTLPLQGGLATTKLASNQLRILRAFRDGAINDLSDGWYFRDWMFRCSLQHRAKKGTITFGYHYGDTAGTLLPGPEVWDESGDLVDPTYRPESEEPRLDASVRIWTSDTGYVPTGAAIPRPNPVTEFAVELDPDVEVVPDSVVLTAGAKRWLLQTQRVRLDLAWFRGGRIESRTRERQVARGDSGQEIFEHLQLHPDVSIIVEARRYPDPPPSIRTRQSIVLLTYATQLPMTASSFAACIDGSERRPPRLAND